MKWKEQIAKWTGTKVELNRKSVRLRKSIDEIQKILCHDKYTKKKKCCKK